MFVKPGVLGVCYNGMHVVVHVAVDDPDELAIETCRCEIEASLQSDAPSAVRFELSRVTLLSGCVLGLMVHCVQLGQRVIACNPSSAARAKLRLTRLDTMIDVESTPDAAENAQTTRIPRRPQREWSTSRDARLSNEMSFTEPEFDATVGAAL